MSAVLDDLLQLRTVSVHFGDDTSTLDVADAKGAGNVLSPDVLARVEVRANEIVAEARPVRVTFEDAATVTGLRKASDRECGRAFASSSCAGNARSGARDRTSTRCRAWRAGFLLQ